MIDERLAQIQADLMACRGTPYDRTSREQRIIIEHVPWLLRQLRSTQAYAEMWRQRCLLLAAGQAVEGDDGGRKAVVDENRRVSEPRVSESALEAARDARGA